MDHSFYDLLIFCDVLFR